MGYVPVATNLATADMSISSPLMTGDSISPDHGPAVHRYGIPGVFNCLIATEDETPAEENALPTGAREMTLRFLAAPTDAGYSGNVGGGRVLQWIDQAGYACAVGWSGRYCVTAFGSWQHPQR